jgi:hypothetical protein
MHLDQETLVRFQHGELDAERLKSARAHVAQCDECRARVVELDREEAEIFDALRAVDHDAPAVNVATIAARARAPQQTSTRTRWAAGILLALGTAGALYALPGALRIFPTEPPEVAAPLPAADEGGSGVRIGANTRLSIVFQHAHPGSHATISLADVADFSVRDLSGAAAFTSDETQLTIDNRAAAARFEIVIPRGAAWVEIRVAGERVFLKDVDGVQTDAPRSPSGEFLLPLGSVDSNSNSNLNLN